MYTVYILQSNKDNRFYIGCTSIDPDQRLKQHNSSRVKSTKHRKIFKLVYTEQYNNKKESFRREWYLKNPKGYQDKLNIINKYSGPLA